MTDPTEVVFPSPGSNGSDVTFEISYQFEAQREYYLLMDAGTVFNVLWLVDSIGGMF